MKTRSVLIVDDNLDFRDLCSEAARMHGCETISFADAEGALEWLIESQVTPSLILADLSLPNMSGEEFIQTVRRLQNVPSETSTIAIASGWDHLTSTTREVGADAFLRKPFELDDFFYLLDQHAAC